MKQMLAGLIAMFLLSSCASSSSDQIYLQRANCRISASVTKDAEGHKLGMVFENRADKIVRVQNPMCLNQNVILTVRSGSGKEETQQIAVSSDNCGEYFTLNPGESRTFAVPYTLEALFGLKTPGTYKVNFEYVGGLYEDNGSMYGDQILKSPVEEFALK